MNNIRCTVEIPNNSDVKYEIDKSSGKLFIDRAVNFQYPANYGFVNNTLWDDGDALDIFIIEEQIDTPLIECNVEPFCVIELTDNRISDTKLVGKLPGRLLSQKRLHYINDILYFLQNYKEGIEIKSVSILERDINNTLNRARYLKNMKDIKWTMKKNQEN